MVTRMVDIHKTQTTLTDLLAEVQAGTEILLVDGDKPLARLIPAGETRPRKRTPGLGRGTVLFMSDDFDDPLPDAFWLGADDLV